MYSKISYVLLNEIHSQTKNKSIKYNLSRSCVATARYVQ